MDHSFEQLLLNRLDKLENKIDKIGTESIPQVKTDVAVLINENKASSKLHSSIAGALAVMVSALLGKMHQ